jgi:hypothetical protein
MDGLKPTAGVVPSGSVRPRGRPFSPGVSGNPKGRPKGSRNKTTLIAEALRSGEAEALTRKIVERAMHGDAVALRICLDRLLPRRRDRCVEFELPELAAGEVVEAARAVLAACAAWSQPMSEPSRSASSGRGGPSWRGSSKHARRQLWRTDEPFGAFGASDRERGRQALLHDRGLVVLSIDVTRRRKS